MKWKLILAAVIFAAPAHSQQFTTAGEVRPILDATHSSWVAIREFDGKDLLYFTHLLAWRCGLSSIHFGVNNGPEKMWDGEPCYEGQPQPNAIKDDAFLPFISFGFQSIESVQIRLVYDDGEGDSFSFQRRDIMTP